MSDLLTLASLPPGFQFILNAVLCTLRRHGDAQREEMERSLAIDAFLAIGPRDALEAMWAGQAVAMSHAAMAAWMEVGRPDVDPDTSDRHRREAVRLGKAGAQMVRLIHSRRRQNARDAKVDGDNNPATTAAIDPHRAPTTGSVAGAGNERVKPAARSSNLTSDGRAAGMDLISRAAAPPTPRAYQSARSAAGIGSGPARTAAEADAPVVPDRVAAALVRLCNHAGTSPGLPATPGLAAAVASTTAALWRAGLFSSVALPKLPEIVS